MNPGPKRLSQNFGERPVVRVSGAIILDSQCRILATQRSSGAYAGYWEFPGGKIEPGESPEDALVRELREELDAEVCDIQPFATIDYDYPDFHLEMECFTCHLSDVDNLPTKSESSSVEGVSFEAKPSNTNSEAREAGIQGIRLLEHSDARWLDADHLLSVRWLPADIELVEKLQKWLKAKSC